MFPCPLCAFPEAGDYCRDARRRYLRCPVCGLIFVPPSQFITEAAEKQRYDLHRNSPHDDGYRRYLGRLAGPMLRSLAPGGRGLDFGSGPEPLLARMFEEAGHAMAIYDRFYEPAASALERRYDFITASEVLEHLREPRAVLDNLWACLQPGGLFGVMTQFAAGPDAFPSWHYKNDPTHILFFSPETFGWLGQRWGSTPVFPERDVALFRKGGEGAFPDAHRGAVA